MQFNKICGMILSKDAAKHYLGLCHFLQNNISYSLRHNKRRGLARQDRSTWAIRSSRQQGAMHKDIAAIKDAICSRHVGFVEEWKDVAAKWPISPYEESLWNTFSRAMDKNRPVYQLRNWFSHGYSRLDTTFQKENEQFSSLFREYGHLSPTLILLKAKLELGLRDEEAWACRTMIDARPRIKKPLRYTKDCIVAGPELETTRLQTKAREMLEREAMFHWLASTSPDGVCC